MNIVAYSDLWQSDLSGAPASVGEGTVERRLPNDIACQTDRRSVETLLQGDPLTLLLIAHRFQTEMLVQRLSSGLVLEYEAIELVRSSDMPAMFERLEEIEAADDSLQK